MNSETKKSRYKTYFFFNEQDSREKRTKLQREAIIIWMTLDSVVLKYSTSITLYYEVKC